MSDSFVRQCAPLHRVVSCMLQVNEALSDEARESKSVGQLRDQLTDIQVEVEAASTRLALTKARVAQNLRRVDQLKAEAVRATRPFALHHESEVSVVHMKCFSIWFSGFSGSRGVKECTTPGGVTANYFT
jgi:hypothetical protein